jgi:predicted MPP superfamily phosphohydrolase
VHWSVYATAGLFCTMLLAWMFLVEPRLFRVRRFKIPRTIQPEDGAIALKSDRLPPLSMLHLTDTHFRGRDAGKLAFIESVARRERYDLAFLTGDLLERPDGLKNCFALAEALRPRFGAFAVMGGHDHFYGTNILGKYTSLRRGHKAPEGRRVPNPIDELRVGLRDRGVRVLEDESCIVELEGGLTVAIIGLRDAFVFEPDFDAAWRNVPDGAPSIVLAHSPDVLAEAAKRGVDLAFFGHTHGGQVRLPFVGAVVTRSLLPRKHAQGVFRHGHTLCVINNGLGAGVGSNMRLLCPPEVAIVTLE